MTPDECKPGTVVRWVDPNGDVSFGVVRRLVSGKIKAPDNPVNPETCVALLKDLCMEDGSPFDTGLTTPAELTLAPRFLVNGEWSAERGEPLQGALDCAGAGKWTWVAYPPPIGDPRASDNSIQSCGGIAPTYLAAREAAERAVGMQQAP